MKLILQDYYKEKKPGQIYFKHKHKKQFDSEDLQKLE